MSFDVSVLDQALANLTSCVRCRARRIGCDQSLPSCQPCLDAGAECQLYDHILEAEFPRSYVKALYERLQDLERLSASPVTTPQSQVSSPKSASAQDGGVGVPEPLLHQRPSPIHSNGSAGSIATPTERTSKKKNDTRKWGTTSAIHFFDIVCKTLDVGHGVGDELMNPSCMDDPLPATSDWIVSDFADNTQSSSTPRYPHIDAARELLQQYYLCVEIITPILGRDIGDADLVSLYSSLGEPNRSSDVRSTVRAELMLTISLRIAMSTEPRKGSRDLVSHYGRASDAMFTNASSKLRSALEGSVRRSFGSTASNDELETEEMLEKLRIVLLLAVYLILAPSRGNVWQVLGFAERLWRSIMRRDPHDSTTSGLADSRSAPMLYRSFIILERLVGMTLGLPVESIDYDDDPAAAPKDVPQLVCRILGIRARLHATHQAKKPNAPKWSYEGAAIDLDRVDSQVGEWLSQFTLVIESTTFYDYEPTAVRARLLRYGRVMADETKLLAICLRWQESVFRSNRRLSPETDNITESLGRGPELIKSLLTHHAYLSEANIIRTNSGSAARVVFPATWIWAMDIFRIATAASLLHQTLPDSDLGPHIEGVVRLLNDSRLFDCSSLARAVLALSPSQDSALR
ncbi:hypothetical protein F4677DRAFT_427410 [Hypoxylon crocopeplum]|nr:hypothetical protein F4677DRAFT_427410 [Hypoxylon crocopeplum]